MPAQRDAVFSAVSAALRGELDDIIVRRDGRVALFNAGKELMWTGYSPQAELLKGVIVELDEQDRPVRLIAGALAKFYNGGESADNDEAFMRALATPGAQLVVTLKEDGSCLRPWLNPATGAVEFATRGMLRSDTSGGHLDFSGLARQIAAERYPALLDAALVERYTVVTEMIHPANRILTDYGERRDLVVLTVIDNQTARELTRAEVLEFCDAHGLTPVAALAVPAGVELDELVRLLRAHFAGSDLEGAVAAVELPGVEIPFRLKIKGETYLLMMRLARHCTMRRVRELAEDHGLADWDAFVAELRRLTPELPEEVTMRYRELHARWSAWEAGNRAALDELVAEYLALPTLDEPDQKAFALSIAAHPQRAAFFALRKAGVDNAAALLLPKLREARLELLGQEPALDDALAA